MDYKNYLYKKERNYHKGILRKPVGGFSRGRLLDQKSP